MLGGSSTSRSFVSRRAEEFAITASSPTVTPSSDSSVDPSMSYVMDRKGHDYAAAMAFAQQQQAGSTGNIHEVGISHQRMRVRMWIDRDTWRWALGLIYIVAVASIWIAASYIVQSVVDSGVSPFLITYICNSLFVVYIPLVEIACYFEDSVVTFFSGHKNNNDTIIQHSGEVENENLLGEENRGKDQHILDPDNISLVESGLQNPKMVSVAHVPTSETGQIFVVDDSGNEVDEKGRWTRTRVAKVSLLICPFWFFAQLTFNFSLKYTTVTSNTILSSTSSLFTFLVALAFLGETFTWVKLTSVLLCMGGTIIVSMADSSSGINAIATNPLFGDILALVSAGLYAIYITLIRKKLPDEKKGEGQASTAQFLGFLGLFNMLIFLPVALVLNFTGLEPFHKLGWKQLSLIIGKGLLDNVLSDYLWAKAIHLTTTTVATAGLTIQVPIAAVVDSLTGHAPQIMDYIGAAAVMVGFAGINFPSNNSSEDQMSKEDQENANIASVENHLELPTDRSKNIIR